MSSLSKQTGSLPPLGQKHYSYIERTISFLEEGGKEGKHLKIDGDFGDYRMRLFRLKDRKKYANDIKSVFTSTFTRSIMPKQPLDQGLANQIHDIIQSQRHRQQYERQQLQNQLKKHQIIYSKGNLAQTIEQEDHLLYSYIPQYQRNRWFQVKDKSKSESEQKQPPKPKNPIKNSLSLRKKNNKYFFAYLQKNQQKIK